MLAIKLRRFFLLPCLVLLLIAQYTAADAVNPSNAIDQRSLVGIGSSGSNSIDDSHSPTKATTDSPTKESTATTTKAPTDSSTKAPTATKETTAPTATPNKAPTNSPTKATTATKEPSATTTKAPTGSPTKAPTATNLNPAHNYAGDDEGNGGAIFALILMFSFVGAVWFNRIKIKRLLDATEVFDGMGGESSGPASKVTKYRDL
jgi:cytoskeletal protein RodZ